MRRTGAKGWVLGNISVSSQEEERWRGWVRCRKPGCEGRREEGDEESTLARGLDEGGEREGCSKGSLRVEGPISRCSAS